MSTGAMVISLVVAVIAAVASVVGALSSHQSARELASLGHRIEAMDRHADQFRDDYGNFQRTFGAVQELSDIGPMLAAAEILLVNPLTDATLAQSVDKARTLLLAQWSGGRPAAGLDDHLVEARKAARKALLEHAMDRDALLRKRDRVRWWQPWRR